MKRLAGVAVLVAITLVASACSGNHRLSAHVQKQIATMASGQAALLDDPSVKTAQVYGPASNATLVEAVLDEQVTAEGPKAPYYLIVLHGHFVCGDCSHLGGKPLRGTVAATVWSPTSKGYGAFHFGHSLPASMSRLGKPTVISLG